MGSNNLEPFVAPHATTVANTVCQLDPSFMLLSCNYRKDASWGSKPAMSDITQNIRAVCQEYPVGRIILVGTSMGGCTVLTYAATAPEDIKGKIAGIVSVESAGDLIKLHDQTDNSTVRLTLEAMMGGSPEFAKANYEERSFLPNISGLPKSVKVAVISAKEDNIVPPSLQRDVVSSLEKQGNAVKLIEVDDSHGVPESKFYQEGMQFVIQ
jgi:homoserine acetyltransferase